ncbi:hypothetical protein FOCC_FOCC013771 [Frankliniella occidentalis]|nr:hypothetical protein FOCC_FOCC013771 [Frankliniella occidentalis]
MFNHSYGCLKYDYNIIQDLVKGIKDSVLTSNNLHYDYSKLSLEQIEVFNFFKSQLDLASSNSNIGVRRVIIQGKAGCGKSYLIHCMKQLAYEHGGPDSCVVLGPTGVSAKNIGGSTIHSFFRLPTRQSYFKRLVGQELHSFQEKHKNLSVVFIDEYPMVGCKLLAMIDQRCRELKDSSLPFGNLIIYLIGDIYQLKGVGDKALYDNNNPDQWTSLAQLGKAAISSFQKAFLLTEPQRYTDYTYSNFLDRLAVGMCTEEDCQMINSRHISRLTECELKKFEHAIRICSINEDVKEFNNEELMKVDTGIVRINAQNNCSTAFKSVDTYASGLANVLYLAINSRVMLKQNLNVSAGLVNGCLGYVTDILYDEGEKPPAIPRFVIVKFDNVDGYPYLNGGVPIQAIHCSWSINNISCSRVQLPLSLSWACTVHKSQSLTVELCQMNLGETDFELGLTYVALSRVKNLSSLVLMKPISLDHLNCVKRSRMFVERENFLEWLRQLN